MQFPLSNDEHAAVARYLSSIRKQLQDVSDLFKTRYGSGSEIAEEAVQTLACVVHLERDFMLLDGPQSEVLAGLEKIISRPN